MPVVCIIKYLPVLALHSYSRGCWKIISLSQKKKKTIIFLIKKNDFFKRWIKLNKRCAKRFELKNECEKQVRFKAFGLLLYGRAENFSATSRIDNYWIQLTLVQNQGQE